MMIYKIWGFTPVFYMFTFYGVSCLNFFSFLCSTFLSSSYLLFCVSFFPFFLILLYFLPIFSLSFSSFSLVLAKIQLWNARRGSLCVFMRWEFPRLYLDPEEKKVESWGESSPPIPMVYRSTPEAPLASPKRKMGKELSLHFSLDFLVS